MKSDGKIFIVGIIYGGEFDSYSRELFATYDEMYAERYVEKFNNLATKWKTSSAKWKTENSIYKYRSGSMVTDLLCGAKAGYYDLDFRFGGWLSSVP